MLLLIELVTLLLYPLEQPLDLSVVGALLYGLFQVLQGFRKLPENNRVVISVMGSNVLRYLYFTYLFRFYSTFIFHYNLFWRQILYIYSTTFT